MRIDNKIITIFIGTLIFFIINTLIASAVLLSDQGTNVKNSTGTLLSSANLTIEIYNASSGGTLILNQTFTDAIINGSWNLMLNASLEFGERYWKNYKINTEDVNFDGNDRLEFQSPLGLINNVSYINFSLISSCSSGSSIRLVNANGSVECQTDNTTNTSYATWANAVNGTLASTIAANTFGNFNQTFNSTTFFLWALLNRIGIGTTSPQNVLNVLGDINATTS